MPWTWTAASWRSASKKGKGWRSSQFNAIEKAIGRYAVNQPHKVRLQRQLDILLAIAAWWSWKQEKKFGHVAPADQAMAGRKYAASEEALAPAMGGDDFSARVEAVRGLIRDIVDEIDDLMANERAAWGNEHFTDPAHRVDNFMYLVSAQTESPLAQGGDPEYRIRTIQNPQLIENALISASVIKKGDVKLWGPAGFILSAPKQCIGAAASQDLAIANAAGMQHAVEKYVEMLRVYLRATTGPAMPGPAQLAPRLNHHTEVVVLGRSYDRVTTVTGVYLLVDPDQKDASAADVKPGACFRQIVQFTRPPSTVRYVVEPLPMVSDARMQMYRTLNVERGLPIVPIPIEAGTTVNGTYFDSLYKGAIMFPFNPAQMYLHGSREHLDLEAAAARKEVKKDIKFAEHRNCRICGT